MIIDNVRMPVDVERGVKGGPMFSTIVNRTDGGKTSTNQNWQYPLYRGQVGYGIQSKSNLVEIINFFYARRGSAYGFLFRDWSDYEVEDQLVGTGNGATLNFDIIKTYGDDVRPFYRPIKRPIESSFVVKVNNVVVSDTLWSINETTGVLSFSGGSAPANGHAVTVTGEFNIPVMFTADALDIQMELWNVGSIPNIPIMEVRE
jgi:uncharacterized protein (TIGR02217 family)